jgi:hypothetical protein
VALSITTIRIMEPNGDIELVTVGKNESRRKSQRKREDRRLLATHGAIKVISVLEPLPGDVGLTRVVSIIVQLSPLAPHSPVCRNLWTLVRE